MAFTLPPYVIQESNNGIEVDIVRSILEKAGYSLELDYVPFARLADNLAAKRDDCVLTINDSLGGEGRLLQRQPHIVPEHGRPP